MVGDMHVLWIFSDYFLQGCIEEGNVHVCLIGLEVCLKGKIDALKLFKDHSFLPLSDSINLGSEHHILNLSWIYDTLQDQI